MIYKTGMYRIVWTVGCWALKFPRLHLWHYIRTFFALWNPKEWAESVKKIVGGNLEVNRNESTRWRASRNKEQWGIPLCPVLFCLPYGSLLVMRRADPLNRKLTEEEQHTGFNQLGGDGVKPNSYGLLNGQLVIIDYGDQPSYQLAEAAKWFEEWRQQ
jgi:hypothetical protein